MNRAFFIMRNRLLSKCVAWAFLASGALPSVRSIHAQVESLEPNPLEPAGAGAADVLEFRGRTSAGAHLGRAKGGRAKSARARRAEQNPAEMMLRDIDGTNYGRRTGHAALRDSPERAAPQAEGPRRPPSRGEREPLYFTQRGGYERGRYSPGGRYRQSAPTVRTKRQQWF